MGNQQLTASERALLFQSMTRQNMHMLGKKTAKGANETLEFELPKVRYLSRIFLRVNAKLRAFKKSDNSPHTGTISTTLEKLCSIFDRISIDLCNGFAPFMIDGESLLHLNKTTKSVNVFNANNENSLQYFRKVTDSQNNLLQGEFFIPLNIALNERDAIGLILLQNNSTLVNLKLDLSSGNIIQNSADYYTTIDTVEVEPMIETFSVPIDDRAKPDLSVIKMVQSTKHSFKSSGLNTINLNTGTIYRKLILNFKDDEGNPFKPEDITSNIELVFNTSDCNYSISPKMLRAYNALNYGGSVPNEGVYVFDFAMQGLPNLGGSRDLIDTEKLTSFTLRFNSAKSGTVTAIAENIVRVVG